MSSFGDFSSPSLLSAATTFRRSLPMALRISSAATTAAQASYGGRSLPLSSLCNSASS